MLRILHRPAASRSARWSPGIDDPLTLVSSPRTQAFLDTPAKWAVFMEYAVHTALENAPEITQANSVLEARQRALELGGRAYYLPDLALVSNGSKFTDKSGAGSLSVPGAPDDESWSVSLQATLPLFTGGLRGAERSQARHEVRASEADRRPPSTASKRARAWCLHRTASSWPAIDLSREAQAAADENLANVTDAYARGAVSVTDLIDAQETALSRGLSRHRCEIRIHDRFRQRAALDGRVRDPARSGVARSLVRARGNLVPRASAAVRARNVIQQ